ncbi:putative Methyl-accepting chemotaxis receptor/sensory transducer [Candidatus Terasakiella magnetica]|uniref:Putative Methyl-accepting chemotaxis receptor/sensory transducer n=1 Tax=Candidatus Terasakiella magnetica TaxID=1867952 RepID=A0A1C3REP0_9PROT|nr:HAMP domain-containing methyl-accepting chemotaxis protein [Candidatus Terasakiella magnetica]SCA55708.1 putative Methyl-accepting chemotaxis receptor/sensory transducer [Candidatus Terasakiella magnetica]
MSIRFKLLASSIALAFLLLGSIAFTYFELAEISENVEELAIDTDFLGHDVLPLVIVAKDLKLNVVQVQQWLTDISATRGLDGLNDGFDEAEANAKLFKANVEKVKILAAPFKEKALDDIIAKLNSTFDPYYGTGVIMAKAYVAGGPAQGNKTMASFDEVAAAMQDMMDRFQAVIDKDIVKITKQADLHKKETHDIINSATNLAIIPTVLGLIIASLTIFVVLNVSRLIVSMSERMRDLSNGDIDIELTEIDRKDEMGRMCRAVNVFKQKAIENEELKRQQELAQIKATEERKLALQNMADNVQTESQLALQKVSEKVSYMQTAVQEMSDSAHRTNDHSQSVAAAADQSITNAQGVGAATEELSVSIREISQQVDAQSAITQDASTQAEESARTIAGLDEAASNIGNVVTLIQDIAAQTNLLALNATIEAARAGDAGKGFAVVASEVKNLAVQTSQATEEISAQVNAIQADSERSVKQISAISTVLHQLTETTQIVKDTMLSQSDATVEISQNVQENTEASQEVAQRISGVSDEAASSVERTTVVTTEADAIAEGIQELVHHLNHVVRTATQDVDRRHDTRLPTDHLNIKATLNGASIEIDNISNSGALIHGDISLANGEKASLTLSDLDDTLPVTVVHMRGDKIGLTFSNELEHRDEFILWLSHRWNEYIQYAALHT